MLAASNGVKINEMMQGSTLSSWDERLSRSTKSNYNFLTVSKEPFGRLVLLLNLDRMPVWDACFSLSGSPGWLLLLLVLTALLRAQCSMDPQVSSTTEVRDPAKAPPPSSRLTARSRGNLFGQGIDGDLFIFRNLGTVPDLRTGMSHRSTRI